MCIRDRHYYWPLAREPRKELFNTGNILVSISAGGLPLLLAGMPDNLASLPALGLSLLFAALCILVNLTLFILYYQVGGMGPVSYTHLDVYKRQPSAYPCRCSRS